MGVCVSGVWVGMKQGSGSCDRITVFSAPACHAPHSTARCYSRTLLHDAVDERPGCSGSRQSTSSPSGCPPDLKTRMKHQQLPGLCQINDSIQDVLNSITLASATHSAPRSTDCDDVIRKEKQREGREPPKRFYFFFLSLTHSSTLPAYL